jgi:ankyrin repeat protein
LLPLLLTAPDLNFAGTEKSLAEPAQVLRGKIIVETSKNGGEGAKEAVGKGEEEQQGEGAKDAVEEGDEELEPLANLVQIFRVKLTDVASKNGGEEGKEAVEKGEEEQQDEGAKDAVKERDEELREEILWKASPHIYPGRTALHMAVAWGNVEIVEKICSVAKVNFNIQDKFGCTPLHLACASTDARRDEVIKALLDGKNSSQEINANVMAKRTGHYFTPLHFAVKARSKTAVRKLLDWNPKTGPYFGQSLDVDARSLVGLTALHLAVNHSQKGKKLNKKEKKSNESIIRLLIRFINKHSPEAINRSDDLKNTPLHTSVGAKDYKVVEILLEEGDGIDPELLDKKGRTALEVAIHKSDYAMVQTVQNYLERAGIFGNKQAYADSANAILVGAALLATLTFTASVQIQANDSILFWVSSSFSFYFAIATFLSAAGAAIPSRGSTLGDIRRAVHASALCLSISLACAVAAFATAGFILLPPASEYRRMVTATTVIGGTICFFFLVDFVDKIAKASSAFFLWTDYFRKKTIYKPLADQVKKCQNPKFVKDVKRWYNDNVTEGKRQNE